MSVGCVNRLWFINAHMLVLQSSIKAPGLVIILTYCSMLLLIKRRFDNTLDINLHNSSHTYKLMLRISATFLWLQQSYSFKTRWHHFVINQWLFKKSNTILNKASLVLLNIDVFNFVLISVSRRYLLRLTRQELFAYRLNLRGLFSSLLNTLCLFALKIHIIC